MNWKEKSAAIEALTAKLQATIDGYYTLLVRLSTRTLPCEFQESERRYNRLHARRDREFGRLMNQLNTL